MIVSGVLVPAELSGPLATLAQLGRRVLAERDGAAPLRADVAELLDQLVRVAQAGTRRGPMFASERSEVSASEHRATVKTARTATSGDGELTVSAAAGLLACTEQHTRRLARSGHLEARKSGRDWMISRRSVDQYVARQG